MRKIVLGAVSVIALTAAANAADFKKPVYKALPPPPVPVSNWTGFYFGANAGYSWGRADSTVFSGTLDARDVRANVNGWLAGVQAGYNWQIGSSFLFGFEADAQLTGERGGLSAAAAPIGVVLGGNTLVTTVTANNSYSMPWFATFRGRLGVLAGPDTLLYGTGGLAVGEVKYSTQNFVTSQLLAPGGAPAGAAVTVAGADLSERQTRLGWALGAGIEHKFTPSLSAKVEYLYLDFGHRTYFGNVVGTQTDVRFRDHIARVGLNYAFDYGVIAARY